MSTEPGHDQPDVLPPFVLVHGGRHGGWCWRRVAVLLRAAGHEVFTPTLTGLGERRHLLTRDIGLDTHVADVVGVFEYEDLWDTVLVAHSYGGMVISGALEQVAKRVRCTVFVDAHLPRAGESIFDLTGPGVAESLTLQAQERGDGWLVPVADASWWGIEDPADVAWVNARTTPQPIKTYRDHLKSADRVWAHPGTFVDCTRSVARSAAADRARARSLTDPSFHWRELDSDHEPMVTAPRELAALLLEAAGRDFPGRG